MTTWSTDMTAVPPDSQQRDRVCVTISVNLLNAMIGLVKDRWVASMRKKDEREWRELNIEASGLNTLLVERSLREGVDPFAG